MRGVASVSCVYGIAERRVNVKRYRAGLVPGGTEPLAGVESGP